MAINMAECAGHDNHLCNLVEKKTPVDTIKKMVREPKFICSGCGRVAQSKDNLCAPEEI